MGTAGRRDIASGGIAQASDGGGRAAKGQGRPDAVLRLADLVEELARGPAGTV